MFFSLADGLINSDGRHHYGIITPKGFNAQNEDGSEVVKNILSIAFCDARFQKYLFANVLKLAGNAAMDNKKNRIIRRHIQFAIRNDEELSKLLGTIMVASGDVLPNIH
ncbi:hypothetical protein C4D60_Mb02t03590 [Musa balbisiana]|uniref:Histone H2A n=1 Tax=Musa balbisiana TaxID=52838 RepID=A0A4S8I8V1_MUSBA|nr:hypothetical protein C4D60_Mb02t03590 [Musa balbisiana]